MFATWARTMRIGFRAAGNVVDLQARAKALAALVLSCLFVSHPIRRYQHFGGLQVRGHPAKRLPKAWRKLCRGFTKPGSFAFFCSIQIHLNPAFRGPKPTNSVHRGSTAFHVVVWEHLRGKRGPCSLQGATIFGIGDHYQ